MIPVPARHAASVVLCVLGSCQSSAPEAESAPQPGKAAEATTNVRPVEELPERYRALWQAWLADEEGWSARRAEALADPALAGFLVDNLVRELMRSYRAGEFTRTDSEKIGNFERTRAELIVLGERAAPLLAEVLGIAASDIADVAATVLAEIGRPSVVAVAAQLERKDLEQARMRAAVLLGRLPHAVGDEPKVRAQLAAHLASDPHWLVRAKCAETIGRRGYADIETKPAREALAAALRDSDEDVRISAVKGLAWLRDPESIPP
jgi:HEAT repeat protein